MRRLLTKKLSINKDIQITALNGLIVLLSVFFLNAYIARTQGMEILGEFLLLKRSVFSIVGILLLGMGVGLPNYLAKETNHNFGHSAVAIFFTITFPLLYILYFSVDSGFIDGFSPRNSVAYGLFTLGVCFQAMTYALFRGHINMIGANLIQLVGTALIPLCMFIIIDEFRTIIIVIGITTIIIMVTAFIMRNGGINVKKMYWQDIKLLISFGIRRVPSIVAQFILIAGMPIILAAELSSSNLAYFISSISLIRLSLLVVNPVGMVLLPRVSQALSRGQTTNVKAGLEKMIVWTFFFGGLAAISLSLYGGDIMKLWLGSITKEGASATQLMLLVLPFYTLSGLLRSPIDAASVKGYNSWIYSLSAIVMVLSFYVLKWQGIQFFNAGVYSFIISHLFSSVYSILVANKLLSIQFYQPRILRDLIVGIILIIGLNMGIEQWVQNPYYQMLIFYSVSLLGLTGFVLKSSKEWVLVFRRELIHFFH